MDMLKPPPPLNLSASNIKQAFIDWKQKFQLYFIASGAEGKLKDEQQCALLLHSVGDEGLAVYNTLENKESLKFKDILEKLEAHCSPPSNETYNRHVFFSRKQKVGETFEDFVTSLKKLSMECNFENLKDGLVRDQIILGLLDDDLKENLLRIQDLNLEKCIHRCRAAETTRTQMDNIKNKGKLEIGKIGAENTRRMKKEDQQWENKERGRSISRQPSGLGELQYQYQIKLQDNCIPVAERPRKIPFKLEDKVKNELDRMERLGVIRKVTEPTEWTFNVTVTQSANITKPPSSKQAPRASTVRLACSAQGRPAPNITWYKDGVPLALTGRIGLRKSPDEERIELVISSVTSDDAGIYQCFASNSFSSSSAWAAVGVTGADAAPPHRVTCEPVGAREVAVRWLPAQEPVVAYTVHTTRQGRQRVGRGSGLESSSSQPVYVPLLGTGLLSEQEGLGHSSHAGPVRTGNFTYTIELLRSELWRELCLGFLYGTESEMRRYVAKRVSSLKWQWAGHIARRADGRWGRKVLEWRPRIGKRSVGHQQDGRMTWLKPRVHGGCRPLPTEATGDKPGSSLPGQPHKNTQEIVTVAEALTPYKFQVRAYIQSMKNMATDFSEGVVCQGQGVPIKLVKLDTNSVLVSWQKFSTENPGVVEWLLQSRFQDADLVQNVTLDADATNYTLTIPSDGILEVRVLGTRSLPWLQQNLTHVPWYSATDSGDGVSAPRDLEVTQITAHGFSMRWETDQPQKHFLVCVTKVEGIEECQLSDTNSITIENLQPSSEYEVRVQTKVPGREAAEATLSYHVVTIPEGPHHFKDVTHKFINASTLRVSWGGAPGRYAVKHTSDVHKPIEQWSLVTTMGNTVLITGVQPGETTFLMVTGFEPPAQSQIITVPPIINNEPDAVDLSYVYTSNGVTVSWSGVGPRVVRFAQNITRPLEAWRVVNVTENHVQLAGLDASLPTFVTVTAPGSGRPSQVLTIPARPHDVSAISIGVGVGCLVCVLLLLAVAAFCIWRKRKIAQSPARSRRRNVSPTEGHEGESSEMKSVGGRLANGGAAGEPLLNGHVHITENPTSKTPNGKMRKPCYEAFDLSRYDPDTTAETLLDADTSAPYLLDTSRRPEAHPRPLSTNNSFNKLPDDNMNSEITRSTDFSLDNSKIQPTLQPNG
ncbi:hypothetical protein MSG28_008327 [Choristoneura fumiferana]|uniref:Uncharacterized protein n=1 Tax=Choristoneura fumiferana TaxID=7141 RepID=A0ACC0JB62_CHOFU|nr:hypothetical protein MSG28_008327 [Choristoneura fumiferana]